MNYNSQSKESRSKKANSWVKKMNELHSTEIKESVKNSILYPIKSSIHIDDNINNINTSIDIRGDLDSVSAIFEYKRRYNSIAILNFAS